MTERHRQLEKLLHEMLETFDGTAASFAQQADLSPATISKLRQGSTRFTRNVVSRIAKAHGDVGGHDLLVTWSELTGEPMPKSMADASPGSRNIESSPSDVLSALEVRHAPARWTATADDVQRDLQDKRPIDVGPLVEFLSSTGADSFVRAFGLETQPPFPLSDGCQQALHALAHDLFDHVTERILLGISGSAQTKFNSLVKYIEDRAQVWSADDPPADVVLVTGARRRIDGRMAKALEVWDHASTDAVMLLTGMRPSYEAARVPFTEAEAMKHYLENDLAIQLPEDRVLVEERPYTLRETAVLSVPQFQAKRLQTRRPIMVVAIAAPHCARRLRLILDRALADMTDVVSAVSIAGNQPRTTPESICRPNFRGRESVRFGVQLYLGEYLKLIGGRVAGEY